MRFPGLPRSWYSDPLQVLPAHDLSGKIKASDLFFTIIAQRGGLNRTGADSKERSKAVIGAVKVFTFLQWPAALYDLIQPINIVNMQTQGQTQRIKTAVTTGNPFVVSAMGGRSGGIYNLDVDHGKTCKRI
jgi:hypothetical protein